MDIDQMNALEYTIYLDMGRIPYFIEGKNINHNEVWFALKYIIKYISLLCGPNILDNEDIEMVYFNIHYLTNNIVDLTNEVNDTTLQIECSHFIEQKILKYEEKALQLEMYEVLQNLKEFKKIYGI